MAAGVGSSVWRCDCKGVLEAASPGDDDGRLRTGQLRHPPPRRERHK